MVIRPRNLIPAVRCLCLLLITASPLFAQIAFNNFSSTTNLKLNGSVAQSGNVLRITPAAGNQVGSAWYLTKQPLANGFSTTFQFQFSNPSTPPADGIAFVIQNAGTSAIGSPPNGGALGYGDDDGNQHPESGIASSIAIEFDSFQNSWDPAPPAGSSSHVAVQSCGTGNNTSHHGQACPASGLSSTLGAPVLTPNITNGAVHKVTISYVPPASDCTGTCTGTLHVILDDVDLYASGLAVNLTDLLGLSDGTAYIGFTGATGGNWENQDILSWTFDPVAKTAQVPPGQTATLPFQNNAYDYEATNGGASPVTVSVTPILTDPATCNALVGDTFPGAKCIIYKNAEGSGLDTAVMFELTCPQLASSPECNPFDAQLATTYELSTANSDFNYVTPFPGWVKGHGTNAAHPCAAAPSNSPHLFQSNQISSFLLTDTDPKTRGSSGGTGSCWVATYNQPDEVPPGITISSPTNTTYTQGQQVIASYVCSDPATSKQSTNPTGPYLTAMTCQQTNDAQGPTTGVCTQGTSSISCTGSVDTSTLGPHSFTVTARDTGKNTATQSVSYTVVGLNADLAILNLGPAKVGTTKNITYAIGGTNLGPNLATGVVISNPLPANTLFVNGSGSNVSCSVVNRKLVCTTANFTCTASGGVATCNVGSIAPLTWSSLNGTVLSLTLKVNAAANSSLKDTASISSLNVDSKMSNNSSSVTTSVTK
ncbi:MAG TPA: hypothetical protein VLK33_15335 [Terriglobales bacterium]|nr:hypothetical protein [Terriglobales bacterium]